MGSDNSIESRISKQSYGSVPLEGIELIYKQMKKSLCKITNNNHFGTAFLCKIPFPNNDRFFPVLITTNALLGKNDLTLGKKINLNFNEKYIEVTIDSKRKTFIDEKNNVVIIEIKSTDNIDFDSILEIDNNIFDDKAYKYFINKRIYIISYRFTSEIKYSSGIICNINNSEILHNCSSPNNSIGAPIINANNYKVIGIHLGENSLNKASCGIFLKEPIQNFNKEMNNGQHLIAINKELENTINLMENQLNEEKNKNLNLINQIKELKNVIQEKDIILRKEREKVVQLNTKMNEFRGVLSTNPQILKTLELVEKLEQKENEIKEIKSRYPVELLKGEKLLSIIFISVDQDIHCSLICKNTDPFSKLERKLYEEYPKYLESENYFMVGGKKINRFKNLDENGIKNSDIIILKSYNDN